MTTMVSCSGCERFVRATDSECPFCGMARTARTIRLRRPNVARSAMVAMALASGCGATQTPVYGGPPPPESSGPQESGSGSTQDDTSELDTSPEADADDQAEVDVPVPVYGASVPEE